MELLVGRSITVRPMRPNDITEWTLNLDLQGHPAEECVVVEAQDLGSCLAALVHAPTATLLWSDSDGEGTPIANAGDFVAALATLIEVIR